MIVSASGGRLRSHRENSLCSLCVINTREGGEGVPRRLSGKFSVLIPPQSAGLGTDDPRLRD